MNCISCGRSSFILHSEDSYMHLPVYRCKNCDLLVTGTSVSDIKNKSEEVYARTHNNESSHVTALESDFTDIHSQSKKRRLLSRCLYCKPYLKDKKDLLEIGSGAGQSLIFFEEIGFTVLGVEPNTKSVPLINKKLKKGKCMVGFAEELEIDKKFDIIWVHHVFEHLMEPDMLLRKWKNILRDDGIIFIEVPNCENDEILRRSINDNPSSFHYSKQSLLNLAKNAGYAVEHCDFFKSPNLLNGAINKIMKKLLKFTGRDLYPFYPGIIASNKNGEDICIILKNKL